MEITKDTFLKAEDPRNRDAMLFDMLSSISGQITEYNEIKGSVERCQQDIVMIKTTGVVLTTILTAVGSWFGFR